MAKKMVCVVLFCLIVNTSNASGLAEDPDPADDATNVPQDKILQWTAGSGAASHDIYFGTDANGVGAAERLAGDLDGNGQADYKDISILTNYWLQNPDGSEPYAGVNDDNTVNLADYAILANNWKIQGSPLFKCNTAAASFTPDLALNTTYYWRVDEVNGPDTLKGDVWSFTTVPFLTYPYLTWRNNTANSVIVNWWNPVAAGDSSVDYGPTNSYGSTATVATATNFHHVELAGLTAGATYHYRIRSSDGTIGADNTYTVPAAFLASFSFAVYGDPRGVYNANEPYYTRHQALCNWILAQNYDFALEMGDTVWDGGGARAQGFYTDFFRLESNLSKSKVIMATMGGHEGQPAGLSYYHYYDLYADAFPANGTIGNKGKVYSFNYGNAHFVCLSSYTISLTTQATWLAADLAAARANPNIKWIFAFMHAPMYTTSGHPNRTDEITAWGPIFDLYNVDIVFASHNRLYERSKSIKAGAAAPDGTGTVYITSGLGGAEFNPAGADPEELFVTTYTGQTSAASVAISGNQLTVQAITNGDNIVRDTFTLSK